MRSLLLLFSEWNFSIACFFVLFFHYPVALSVCFRAIYFPETRAREIRCSCIHIPKIHWRTHIQTHTNWVGATIWFHKKECLTQAKNYVQKRAVNIRKTVQSLDSFVFSMLMLYDMWPMMMKNNRYKFYKILLLTSHLRVFCLFLFRYRYAIALNERTTRKWYGQRRI